MENCERARDVRLVDIGAENWERVVALSGNGDADVWSDFVAPNMYSICQSLYEPGWKVRAIEADGEIAGFAMYGFPENDRLWELCRFMVDVKRQNLGIGRRALALIVEDMRRDPSCDKIYLSTEPSNARGIHLYTSFGFTATGEMDGGEAIYVLEGEPRL